MDHSSPVRLNADAVQGTKALDPSTILERAADLIEPEGKWIQGEWALAAGGKLTTGSRPAACWCALGAIWEVADVWSDSLSAEAEDALQAFIDPTYRLSIANWNDAPERTQAEVVAALRKAAARARSTGTAQATGPVSEVSQPTDASNGPGRK